MAEKYFLSAADRETLKSVIDEVMGSRVNTPSRSDQPTRLGAPETYLAFIPTGGIAAATDSGGTGTGTDETIGVPGSAECELYSIEGYESTASLVRIPGLTRLVYNPFPVAVTAGQFVVVTRTKGGSWVVTGNVQDASAATTNRIVDVVHVVGGTGTGTGVGTGSDGDAWYCERVTLVGGTWPPVAVPSVYYTGVRESENREPRIVDVPGGAVTHAIPLYEDVDGSRYVQFWKTDTQSDWQDIASFTITEDAATCVLTATPTYRTLRARLVVADPLLTNTGLTLTITEI